MEYGFNHYFTVVLLDLALYVGMSVEDYWHSDPLLLGNHIEAFNRRRKDEFYNAWLNGYYFKCALQSTILSSAPLLTGKAPDLPKYPEPIGYEEHKNRPLTEMEKQRKRDEIYMNMNMIMYAQQRAHK